MHSDMVDILREVTSDMMREVPYRGSARLYSYVKTFKN